MQSTRKKIATPATRDNFLSKGISMRYLYYDKDSKYITEVEIKPEDRGK